MIRRQLVGSQVLAGPDLQIKNIFVYTDNGIQCGKIGFVYPTAVAVFVVQGDCAAAPQKVKQMYFILATIEEIPDWRMGLLKLQLVVEADFLSSFATCTIHR